MIDIVDVAFAVPQFHQRLDAGDDIIAIQRALSIRFIEIQPHVHLDPANGREVIAFGIKEQCIKERRRGLFGGRLAGAHDAVDVHERALAVHVLVRRHGVANIGTDVDAVDVENRNICDPGIKQILKRTPGDFAILAVLQRQLIARLDIDRASFLVDDIARHEFADDMLEGNQELGYIPLVDQLLDRARCDLFARFKNHFAGVGIDQVIGGAGAADTLWEELGDPALFLFQLVIYGVVIGIHDAFLIETERIKQRRHRQFAATVDTGEHDILRVKLEVQPRPTIGNDPAGKQQLARRMGLALVMIKEHAGAAVHLGHDHALGAIDDKGAIGRHQGHIAHEHILLLDILDRFGAGILVDIEHDQTQLDLERGRIGHIALHALIDVILGLFQLVADEFQHAGLVEILDRENRLEDALDAFAVLRLRLVAGFQEQVIRGFLNLDQIRHLQHFADFAVISAQAFLAKEALSHGRCHLSFLTGRARCWGSAPRPSETAGFDPFMVIVPMMTSRSCKPRLRKAPVSAGPL